MPTLRNPSRPLYSVPFRTRGESGVAKGERAAAMEVSVYETSRAGRQLERVSDFAIGSEVTPLTLKPTETYQTITGIGGSFTAASAYLLNRLGAENRRRIIDAYFADSGARYSLTRTHINSCDFSLGNYAYATEAGDTDLSSFTIEEDEKDIIPMIKDAMAASAEGFRIIASPWTAPPWMKTNNDWRGGKLRPEYGPTWASYFSKYIAAYGEVGIPIWAVTVENEPLGNDVNWESMHFSPAEQTDFVVNHLGPTLRRDCPDVKILGYDQNRGEELRDWVASMFGEEEPARYFDGTAVHWYASTYDPFRDNLDYAHGVAPAKHLIQTEGCVDAEVPKWRDDDWYWSKEATDWGWDWAAEERKYLHPKYVPVYRYARDIIACLNHHVDGWVDWNMVLNRQGGPNWFENWCVAPVIVDEEADEVYFTPLYYTMAQFSKFIRPGGKRIGLEMADKELLATAVRNPDGTIAMALLNEGADARSYELRLNGRAAAISIGPQTVQTVLIHSANLTTTL